MKRVLAAFALAVVAADAQAAVPSIVDGSVVMTPGRKKVAVTYRLEGAPGIVTMDVQTNRGDDVWVSIGGAAFAAGLSGDVGHVVDKDADHEIIWDAHKTWPDRVIANGGIRAVLTAWATNAPPDWLAVDLARENTHFFCAREEDLPVAVGSAESKARWLILKRVHASGVRWVMGANSITDTNAGSNETPHFVTLTNDYYMGVYEFTQGQFMAMGGSWAANFKYPTLTNLVEKPLVGFVWDTIRGDTTWPGEGLTRAAAHAVGSSSILKKLRDRTGIDFDLPTEAQWEFACRAGTETPLYTGYRATADMADVVAWTEDNTPEVQFNTYSGDAVTAHEMQPVGGKAPNAWGFYDILGNVWEFCIDSYVDKMSADEVFEPQGPTTDTAPRSRRGGGIYGGATYASASRRGTTNKGAAYYYNGFRVMCPVSLKW